MRPRNLIKRLRYKPTVEELAQELLRRVGVRWVSSEASWRQRRERNWWSLQLGRSNYQEVLKAYYDAKSSCIALPATYSGEPPAGPPSGPPVDEPWTRPGVRSRLSELASLCLGLRQPLTA
jgi:hypothetical protein